MEVDLSSVFEIEQQQKKPFYVSHHFTVCEKCFSVYENSEVEHK